MCTNTPRISVDLIDRLTRVTSDIREAIETGDTKLGPIDESADIESVIALILGEADEHELDLRECGTSRAELRRWARPLFLNRVHDMINDGLEHKRQERWNDVGRTLNLVRDRMQNAGILGIQPADVEEIYKRIFFELQP